MHTALDKALKNEKKSVKTINDKLCKLAREHSQHKKELKKVNQKLEAYRFDALVALVSADEASASIEEFKTYQTLLSQKKPAENNKKKMLREGQKDLKLLYSQRRALILEGAVLDRHLDASSSKYKERMW